MSTDRETTWKGKEVLEKLAQIYEQLYLTPGEEGERLYPGIVRRGEYAPNKTLEHFKGTEEDRCEYVMTPAGEVRVITLHDRGDFETFLRIMAERCRETVIPPTQGAAILVGVINHRKIEQHREQFYRNAREAGKPEPTWLEWDLERAQFTQDKANYTDALIVLSVGPYSAVCAEWAGFSESEWLSLSHTIREYHECTHFVCRRFYPKKIDAIWDELVADAVGIVAALGRYDMRLAGLVLGIENGEYVGGRLANYVPSGVTDKEEYIEGIRRKILRTMEAIQELSPTAADDPFALAIALEEKKDALWDIG